MQKSFFMIVLMSVLFLSLGCSEDKGSGDELETNIDKAIAVLECFETGKTDPIKKYINEREFIQHTPIFPNGRKAWITAIEKHTLGDDPLVNVIRSFEDGDYVILHSKYYLYDQNRVVFDVFRFQNGLIVEHWDNGVIYHGNFVNNNGHSMLDGPTIITDPDATEKYKRMVRTYVETVLIDGQTDKFNDYFQRVPIYEKLDEEEASVRDPEIIGYEFLLDQHDYRLPSGADYIKSYIEANHGNDQEREQHGYIHHLWGNGNFVLTVSEGTYQEAPVAIYDLFFLEHFIPDEKAISLGYKEKDIIAHQWTIVSEIPPRDQWQNENQKF